MSEVAIHNEERVRRLFAAHNQGPDAILAALEELFDPEIRWTPAVVGGLEGGTYTGYDGMRRYYADRDDAFGEGRVEVIGCEPVGDDVVVAHVLSRGVGRMSGATIEHELWIVVWLRDGRVVREHAFTARSDAMKAAGA